MKTKIIYISGNEIFDMADIRAAFDEVRNALNLGGDTVLFGVPVDADDAGLGTGDNMPAMAAPTEPVASVEIPEPVADDTDASADIPAPIQKPKRATRRTRIAAAAPVTSDDATDTVITPDAETPTPIVTDDAPAAPESDADTSTDDTIIPILSVLASGAPVAADAPATDAQPMDAPASDVAADDVQPDMESETIAPTDDVVPVADTEQIESETIVSITETVTIEDMLTDDVPAPAVEKTLEQLLEKMTPLREDRTDVLDTADEFSAPVMDTAPVAPADAAPQISDTDATLAQLATEFAENEDKITPMPAAEHHGKIGKLKNILPFKKAKRDDAGLMGDLFGWAGIAANDDEFSIPGFFTNAASKK